MTTEELVEVQSLIHIKGPKTSDVNIYFGKHRVGGIQKIQYINHAANMLPTFKLKFPFMVLHEAANAEVNDTDIVIIQPGTFHTKTRPAMINYNCSAQIYLGKTRLTAIKEIKLTANVERLNHSLTIKYFDCFPHGFPSMPEWVNLKCIKIGY